MRLVYGLNYTMERLFQLLDLRCMSAKLKQCGFSNLQYGVSYLPSYYLRKHTGR